MQLLTFAFYAYLCATGTFATLIVTTPKESSVYDFTTLDGLAQINCEWGPALEDDKKEVITKYTFTLCSGSNDNIVLVSMLASVPGDTVEDGEYTVQFSNDVGSDGYYFIQIYAETKSGYSVNYSSRFYLKGMRGKMAATTEMTDLHPPVAEVVVTTRRNIGAKYSAETGRTRYAPMQSQPPTKITATRWKRQYPTSAVTYYKTMEAVIAKDATLTPDQTYIQQLYVNYATPASMPSDNGGWYKPYMKLTRAPRKVNHGMT